jgi:hypothetical protein
VAIAEKEKKKVHDATPVVGLEKKTSSKRKAPDAIETNKVVHIEEKQPEVGKPKEKKSRVDSSTRGDEDTNILATPQIQLTGKYAPKDKKPKVPKDQPTIAPMDPTEAAEIEARSELGHIYFSSTCPPRERMKQTPEEEVASKRYWEHYERTGDLLITDPVPKNPVARLMDVIDNIEELYYIDDGTPMKTLEKCLVVLVPDEARVNLS